MQRISVAGPWVTQKEVDYVADAAANAWFEKAYSYNQRFEEAFARYLGVKHAISLPHCTAGIHLGLLALGIGPGDEVIVPDVTWIATMAPVKYVGATPVFADIDPVTWCISAKSFEACITPRTKAVLPVDLYGGMPDWDAILEIAQRHGLAVIEDAAEAIGSEYKGRKAGSFGDAAVFSFHGSKTLTTGEGGMLVTNRSDVHQRALFLRDHGRPPGDRMFYNTEVAFKYRMSSLQAAFGLAQLERIEDLVGRKREIFSWYAGELQDVDGVTMNAEPPHTRNSYWMSTVVLDPKFGMRKERVMELLSAQGIDTRPFFHPLSDIPACRDWPEAVMARSQHKQSHALAAHGINLPSSAMLTKAQVGQITEALKMILSANCLSQA